MKKGFILYLDSLSVLDELNDQQTAILFRALRDYNLGKEPELDFAMRMAFLPFKNQFIRDNEEYQRTCERNRNNGSKGGRPKNPTKPTETQKTHSVLEKPKKADKDTDTDKDNIIKCFDLFWDAYDKKIGRDKCYSIFSKIKPELYETIINQAKQYNKATPDKQFRKHPATWLNGKHWEDEIKTDEPKMIKAFHPIIFD